MQLGFSCIFKVFFLSYLALQCLHRKNIGELVKSQERLGGEKI
nr:MAG TPA: hypothetical protein [Caudoviricetes sp.]